MQYVHLCTRRFHSNSPIGTGKTTTARKMGQVYYDMGLLSSSDVVECSATDLIGQYVGHTGPKTVKLLEKGLGKVLFVDEAYRLGDGGFATEAVNELVDNLTKPKFFGKIVVILAGYDADMNQLLSVNQGLSSRFSEEVVFTNMKPQECLTLLVQKLEKAGVEAVFDSPMENADLISMFQHFTGLSSWGNGRDVGTISRTIIGLTFREAEATATKLTVSYSVIMNVLKEEYRKQQERCHASKPFSMRTSKVKDNATAKQQELYSQPPPPPPMSASKATAEAKNTERPPPDSKSSCNPDETPRDDGVIEADWIQLQLDKQVSKMAQEALDKEIASSKAKYETKEKEQNKRREEMVAIQEAQKKARDDAELEELKRRHEEARIKEINEKRAIRKAREAFEKAEREKREQQKIQQKLRQMGVCCMGYHWIKQQTGYRCAGGSHFVTNDALGI